MHESARASDHKANAFLCACVSILLACYNATKAARSKCDILRSDPATHTLEFHLGLKLFLVSSY